MAHLVLAGDIVGGEHPHHAGQGPGLLRVDGQHPGTGIGTADSAGIDHAVQVDIVRIDTGTGDLFLYVHSRHPLAQGPVLGSLRDLSGPEELRRE